MRLRKEIEPDFETAEKLYPDVLKLISEYAAYCDEHGDEGCVEYKNLENKLHRITGKDMSLFNLWEWWEGSGAENLAFDICLPDPYKVEHLTKSELAEVVKRMKTFEIPDLEDESFRSLFYNYTCFGSDYYPGFLKANCKAYNISLFQRHKNKDGEYFEYSEEDITDHLWNGGMI